MFLFAILALGSWWLVRSVPELMPPGIDPQLRQDPDFRLDQFTVKSFDATGRLTREISGQSATHFPATQSLHIEGVRILAENEAGTRLTAQAQKGISREAVQQVTLTGDAQAVRQADAQGPRVELRGETFTVGLEDERLVSDQPVRITRGAEGPRARRFATKADPLKGPHNRNKPDSNPSNPRRMGPDFSGGSRHAGSQKRQSPATQGFGLSWAEGSAHGLNQ